MLLLGVNLSIRHLLPAGWEVMPGIPSAMLTPSDTVLQVSAIVKVGKTLGGSQLLNIANLPAVHYPFVLGIPRQLPCAPFTVEHQDAITDSLFLLLKLFVTQDCSMTTPPQVRLTVVSKENPAGQAIAAQVERMHVPESKKLSFCRACGATEWDSQEGRHYTIDIATRDPASGPRVQVLSVSAVAMTLVIYVGDGNQSPGGIKDSKLAQRLRSELMRLPIGLRAGQKSRTPANLSVALTKATACGRAWMWQMPCPTQEQSVLGG